MPNSIRQEVFLYVNILPSNRLSPYAVAIRSRYILNGSAFLTVGFIPLGVSCLAGSLYSRWYLSVDLVPTIAPRLQHVSTRSQWLSNGGDDASPYTLVSWRSVLLVWCFSSHVTAANVKFSVSCRIRVRPWCFNVVALLDIARSVGTFHSDEQAPRSVDQNSSIASISGCNHGSSSSTTPFYNGIDRCRCQYSEPGSLERSSGEQHCAHYKHHKNDAIAPHPDRQRTHQVREGENQALLRRRRSKGRAAAWALRNSLAAQSI